MNDSYTQIIASQGAPAEAIVRSYLNKVYTWMATSMAVTAGAAVYALYNEALFDWCVGNLGIMLIGTLGIILALSFLHRLFSATVVSALFLVFSAMEGLSLAPLLSGYSSNIIGLAFACTAGMFGCMSLYGATTKRDLSSWRRFLLMALFGLIIAGVANIFWGTSTLDFGISCLGVLIFSGLTAAHTQEIIQAGLVLEGEDRAKGAVFGALSLYLDFLNIFLYLLRILGSRD